MNALYSPQTIPPDFKGRWYVLDAIAAAVQTFIRKHPRAVADEIQECADNAVLSIFRTEYGPAAVYA
jgi:hypothetical protein